MSQFINHQNKNIKIIKKNLKGHHCTRIRIKRMKIYLGAKNKISNTTTTE